MKCNECKTGNISIDKFDSKYLVRCDNEDCLNTFNVPSPYKIGALLIYNYELQQEDLVASSFSRKKESQESTELQNKYDALYKKYTSARACIEALKYTTFWRGSQYRKSLKIWLDHNPF
jgi:hypothetical protein